MFFPSVSSFGFFIFGMSGVSLGYHSVLVN